MATVTLKDGKVSNRSITTLGVHFERNVPRVVDTATARTLQSDTRFHVSYEPGEAEVIGDVETAAAGRGKPASLTDRLQRIRDAAGELAVDVPGNFKTNGHPSAVALTRVLGWQVTTREVEEAMSLSQANEAMHRKHAAGAERRTGGVVIRKTPRVEPLLDTAVKEGDQSEDPTVQGAVTV